MNHNKIGILLERYLKGETSLEENDKIERWLEENDNSGSQWQEMGRSDKDQWLSTVFNEIKETIHTDHSTVVSIRPRKYFWRRIAAAAAVLFILCSLYLVWPVWQKHISYAELMTLRLPADQKKRVILADGSKIWLNAGSELKYPAKFNGRSREVYLSGEAYFDIEHDAQKPFLIHTGNVVTTVLGTAFNIKEDQTSHTIEVTVTRGKVSVADGSKLLGVITPDQQMSLDLVSSRVVQKTVNTKAVIAWQDDDLLFDDITFADAVIQLQQQFGVRISFKSERLKNCRFSGTALKGEKLDKILKAVCAFNHATYQIQANGDVIIDGPGCD